MSPPVRALRTVLPVRRGRRSRPGSPRAAAAAVVLAGLAWQGAALAQYGQPAGNPYGQPAPAPYGQPAAAQPGMQSGGLAPPPPMTEDPATAEEQRTQRDLAQADREDSGRGLEFLWLNAEAGFQHLGLQTFKANNLVDAGLVESTQTGPTYGVGLGLRLVFITVGARFRLGDFSSFQLWTLDAELGIRIPLGDLEPYFTFGGGYASLGVLDSTNLGGGLDAGEADITGFNGRVGFGLDYYLSDAVSLGANLTGDVLALARPGVDPSNLDPGGGTNDPNAAAAEIYKADGSSVGAAATLTAVLGFHF